MSDVKTYGITDPELEIKDKVKCREIVQEILNFGVSQKQIIQIIYLLALELENRDDMLFLLEACKTVADGRVNKGSPSIVTN